MPICTRHDPRTGLVVGLAATAGLLVLPTFPAVANTTFPSQPLRVILGAPTGAAPDVLTRLVAEAMAPSLGQPVIVENRPGAAGSLATAAVASAPADGYTLNVSGCSGDAITHAYTSQGRAPLTLFADLKPVGRLLRDHWLVLVPPDAAAHNLVDFGEQTRRAATAIPYPSLGEGSTPHLQAERLARRLDFKAQHVPYKDNPVHDLAAGRLGYAVLPSASAVPLLHAGRLKALAVLSAQRLAALPEVPTAAESGLPGYVFNGGLCLWAPGATPTAVLERLNRAVAEASRRPALRERMQALGAEPAGDDLEQTARDVRDVAADVERLRADVFGAVR